MVLPTATLLLAAAALCTSTVIKSPEAGAIPPNFELLILHNNDMHARFEQTSQLSGACTTADREAGKCYGGFPRVAYVVKEARKKAATGEGPPVLYLNAGDTYTGTAWFTIYKWKIAAEFINALRPDAVSLGNHEFDNGVNGLTPFIKNLTCPVVTANLILTKVPELAVETNLNKSIIIDVDGVKIGIIGYLTPDTKTQAVTNDVDYIDEVVAINVEVKRLQEQNIRIIIALGHSGHAKDLEIAKEVDGVDLVIGGHTNTFLWNGTSPDVEEPQGPYPTYVTQASGRRVPVVQAYAYTKYLGKILMTFDSNGEINKITGSPILLDNTIPQDQEVLKIIERYRSDGLNVADVTVGSTSVLLDGGRCKTGECNLGNLITDAMVYRYASHYTGEYWTDAPVAIIQSGGIRSSISYMSMPANVTKGDLLIVMPFEGNLAAVSFNGSVLLQMLEHSVAKLSEITPPGEFLQYSGVKVVYDYKRPAGSRVVSALVRCWECKVPKYTKLNKKQMYKVIMPQFVSNGGDGYSMLVDQPKSLGNHEFDEAVDGLVPFIKNISSPVVTANLKLENVPELKELTNLYDSVTLTRNGVKIGIIGYLTPLTKSLAPRNKVEYEEEVPAIRREVEKLKHQGVHILMALGHSGYVSDVEIAKQVDDLDVVIGGHSNTFLWNGESAEKPETPEGPYPVVVNQPSGRKVLVVQAYAYTKYMGKLHLKFDSDGEITQYDGLPILLDNSIPQDQDVLNVINAYSVDVNKLSSEIVGKSTVFLNGDCRVRECNMGNFITDALLDYTKQHFEQHNVNIAICQGGRIRASLNAAQKPFNLTKGDWLSVLPFTDTLTVMTVNGSVLRMALEHSVARWRLIDKVGEFLQFSGMEVVYDLLKPPGVRVVKASAVCSDCGNLDLTDIQDDYKYKVVMPTFLAEGGDGFSIFIGLPQELLPYNELTCVYDYLEKHQVISPGLTGRLTILNENKAIEMSNKAIPSYSTTIHSKNVPYIVIVLTCSTILYQIFSGHFL